MNTLEKITTTKGSYSLTLKVVEIENKIYTLVSVGDPSQSMHIRIDEEDMRRIGLLFEDHSPS
jgi:hypothetical protein